MKEKFKPAKQKDMRFLKSAPDFVYEYEEKEEIDGHIVHHIGEGVYIFEEPIPFGDGKYIKTLEKMYPDLMFVVYYRNKYVRAEDLSHEENYENSGIRLLLFTMSAHYMRHNENTLEYVLLHELSRFSIPADNMEIINDFLYYSNQDNNKEAKDGMSREWHLYFDSFYQSPRHPLWDVYTEDPDSAKEDYPKILGKLSFRYTPDLYEKIDGWKPYRLCEGRIAKYVYPGIYYIEDSLHLPEDYIPLHNWDENQRIYPLISDSGDSDSEVRMGCLGHEEWGGGTLSILEGINARYIAYGKQAVSILKQMEEVIPKYRFTKIITGKNTLTAPKIFDLSDICERSEANPSKKDNHTVSDDAVELVEGEGFRDLTVAYELFFQADRTNYENYKKYDYAYVSGDSLILVNWKGELKVPLDAVSTLRVKKLCDFGSGVTEKVAITVLDRRETMEREFFGDEVYKKYREFLTSRSD